MPGVRIGVLTAVVAASAMVAGCSATVQGTARKATEPPRLDTATVAQLDTGPYDTAASAPYGNAGDNPFLQHQLEAQRMGEYVVGPWRVDATLRDRGQFLDLLKSAPLAEAKTLRSARALDDPLPDVAAAHGFVTGFCSYRVSAAPDPYRSLENCVLTFPDRGAAAAAAQDMAAGAPAPSTPGAPVAVAGQPDAVATLYDDLGDAVIASFTPHGADVLYQLGRSRGANGPADVNALVASTLVAQKESIERFTPTPPETLADMPKDFTNGQLARTLRAPDNTAPAIIGAWRPGAWLHFEDNPARSQALFDEAGVQAVSQRLATVYRTRDQDAAARFADEYAADIAAQPNVRALGDGVAGLPQARCFERTVGYVPPSNPVSARRVWWRFKCVAWADEYAFTTYSGDARDVKQQIAAQYRILSGK